MVGDAVLSVRTASSDCTPSNMTGRFARRSKRRSAKFAARLRTMPASRSGSGRFLSETPKLRIVGRDGGGGGGPGMDVVIGAGNNIAVGIDQNAEFLDHAGRPMPMLPNGEPIPELRPVT